MDKKHRDIRPFDSDRPEREISLFQRSAETDAMLPVPVPLEASEIRRDCEYRGERLRELFREWWSSEEQTLEQLYPQRLMVAWRLMRRLAVLRNVLEPHQRLEELCFNSWHEPFHFGSRMAADTAVYRTCSAVELPLMPPLPESEDPQQDRRLRAYTDLLNYLARDVLLVHRTLAGRQGLAGLLDPGLVRVAMPAPGELMYFEQHLVRESFREFVEHGQDETEVWLEGRGFTQAEIREVMLMIRGFARERVGLDDFEGAKALAVARMQHAAKQLEAALDYRGAAAAIKEEMKIRRMRGEGEELGEETEMVLEVKRANSRKTIEE